jgi:2,4-dienoyl-CoA reductase-like NADH-dependent reductase (Old Yellow Enzyme family)
MLNLKPWRHTMDTLDLTGLSENRIRFLRELVALWRAHEDAEREPAFKKISRKDLPPLPDWWRDALERAKDSPLAKMTEEEIGQWTEELAERGAQRRLAQPAR